MSEFEKFFPFAIEHGFALFPVNAGTKRPAGPWRHNGTSTDPAQWRAWIDEGFMLGVSACASGVILIDVDVSIGRDAAWQCFVDWCKSLGFELPAPYCHTRSGGWHFAFRVPEGFNPEANRGLISIPVSHFRSLGEGEKDAEVISVRNRGYCIAPGSSFDDQPYILARDASAPSECPAAILDMLRLPEVEVTTRGTAGESEVADVSALVAFLDNHGEFDTEPEWFAALGAVKLACGDTPEALEVARQMTNDEATEDALMSRWTRLAAVDTRGNLCRIGSLIHRYREITGKHFPVRKSTKVMFSDVVKQLAASPSIVPGVAPPLPYGLSGAESGNGSVMPRGSSLMGPRGEVIPIDADESLALEFASEHVGDLRHCEEMGKWLRWDGTRWKMDKTSSAYYLVREHLRRVGSGMHFQDARKVLSAKTVAAVERMAKTDPRIATEAAVWDADAWLLNTPGGVVDLRTCVIREARSGDHMTKITAVAPGGDCPTWKAFLHKSLGGDAELIAFVQRMLGYSLTGVTREHALFFLYGPGGNGKGVLLNTISAILGDYSKTAPMETFTASDHKDHPTDLAGLRGARFVMASETEKGRRWAEARIKSMTGGDPISARFMRQDFFEYVPQFKLVIAGNHKPGLRSVDEAIRRRMNMIPFTVKIPPSERDAALPEKLKAEWGGILQWMVEGCLAWQRDGLQPPAAVRAATEEYLSGEDAMATWLDERCERTADGRTPREELFMSWSRWADTAREYIGTKKQFCDAMRAKEFEEYRTNEGVRGFRGVRLRGVPVPPAPLLG
ncbi:phage/plasmid primase, P4 family [Bradyrhizobium sp. CB82]|uniref:phage/plasmid primase, P4 family n=1 Tax=Bradyrhizobium sp. CB82 TaxID=3039159 RepID=UPI0024B11642|nr:phage/plasmid primase, P4 family [Bradyrhizobium sp. CB82]WFU37327.1 phage/plasmid primase, P4 family [Bradyrhizobium sp. CB82]